MKTFLSLATAAAMLTVTAVPALADLDDKYPRVNVPAADWMSVIDVSKKLADAGYDVKEIDRDDGVYEIEAMKADGSRIEAHVHPGTGEILAEKKDDDWF